MCKLKTPESSSAQKDTADIDILIISSSSTEIAAVFHALRMLQAWGKYLAQSKEIQNWQDFKNIISNFACFLTAIANV